MRSPFIFALLSSLVVALRALDLAEILNTGGDFNSFLNKDYYVNPFYTNELNQTITDFLLRKDALNAARVRTVQKAGTFVWVTSLASFAYLNDTITLALVAQRKARRPQVVELVLYNLPDRACTGGEAAGELSLANNGLEIYEHQSVDVQYMLRY